MKRLFTIRNTRTKTIIPNCFFHDKMLAIKERRRLEDETGVTHEVAPGPDHWKTTGRKERS